MHPDRLAFCSDPAHTRPMADFLDVSASLTGRRWIGPDPEQDRLREAMAQATGLPPAVCSVLVRRGVAAEDAAAFLAPTLRDLLPDPMDPARHGTAADRFLGAVRGQREDRDLRRLRRRWRRIGGAAADLAARHGPRRHALYPRPDRRGLWPERTRDAGPGPRPRPDRLRRLRHPCRTTRSRRPKGADVIVLDHHLGGETLPPALAVVNPNRQDEVGDLGHLCAAGVVFLLLVEVNRRLRETGSKGPDLMGFLDLVALATVADVAPLIGVNRAFVRQGLKVMAGRARPGLVALADVARMDTAPTSYHLGFLLGPRVNAGGRIGQADLGARLLVHRGPARGRSAGRTAGPAEHRTPRDREPRCATQPWNRPTARGLDGPLVWAAGEGWHPGVVGIVAARLKEATNRPAVVIGLDGDEGKGSGRSVSGIDLGRGDPPCRRRGSAAEGRRPQDGGGPDRCPRPAGTGDGAAGRAAGQTGRRRHRPARSEPGRPADARRATVDLIEQIETAGPFGAGAPAPRFVFPDQRITFARRVGESHLKISFGDGRAKLDAIAFGAFDTALGPALEDHGGARFHLAGRLEINHWRGRQTAQLRLEDAARG